MPDPLGSSRGTTFRPCASGSLLPPGIPKQQRRSDEQRDEEPVQDQEDSRRAPRAQPEDQRDHGDQRLGERHRAGAMRTSEYPVSELRRTIFPALADDQKVDSHIKLQVRLPENNFSFMFGVLELSAASNTCSTRSKLAFRQDMGACTPVRVRPGESRFVWHRRKPLVYAHYRILVGLLGRESRGSKSFQRGFESHPHHVSPARPGSEEVRILPARSACLVL